MEKMQLISMEYWNLILSFIVLVFSTCVSGNEIAECMLTDSSTGPSCSVGYKSSLN